MDPMSKDRIFKVVFINQGNVVELYARQVGQGNLFGFIEVEDLVFGSRSEVVLDPNEESLRNEFGQADVRQKAHTDTGDMGRSLQADDWYTHP